MNWSAGVVADGTEPSVTVTSTGPAVCAAGEVAVIDVEPFTVTLVADFPPKLTVAVAVKFVPLIVTVVPPAVDPVAGVTPVTVGAGAGGGAGGVGVV